jgi:hypothetical protein
MPAQWRRNETPEVEDVKPKIGSALFGLGFCACFCRGDQARRAESMRNGSNYIVGALVGASMVALSLSTASAFTLSGPSLEQPVATGQIDKVWWHHGWGGGWHGGWHGGGWGWHHGWGGPGWRHCWINQWGNRVCNW